MHLLFLLSIYLFGYHIHERLGVTLNLEFPKSMLDFIHNMQQRPWIENGP